MITIANARHLPKDTPPAIRALISRAIADISAVVEEPLGSNRGPIIDEYNRRAGAPVGSYWCASAVGAWMIDCGFPMPIGYASCDNIMAWGKKTGRWSVLPALGAMVLYGKPADANHVGLVSRLAPLVLSIEGNTTVEGGSAEQSRNGEAVSQKRVNSADPVLGYVLPMVKDAA
ncbi:MAG: hypothetical protein H7099_06280 [Gemmatimonadaceae bacterium]|nr:hypothetical protein [Gemmatimonadaceae bacterium]